MTFHEGERIIDHISLVYLFLEGISRSGGPFFFHCLVAINCNQNIAKVVKLIKGESSHWVNRNRLTTSKFYWQREYYAVSVDRTRLKTIRNYIRNQERHHKNKNLQKELNLFFGSLAGDLSPREKEE